MRVADGTTPTARFFEHAFPDRFATMLATARSVQWDCTPGNAAPGFENDPVVLREKLCHGTALVNRDIIQDKQ